MDAITFVMFYEPMLISALAIAATVWFTRDD